MVTWTGLLKISNIISESVLDILTLTQDYIIEMNQNTNIYFLKVRRMPNEIYSEIINRYSTSTDMTYLETDKEIKTP